MSDNLRDEQVSYGLLRTSYVRDFYAKFQTNLGLRCDSTEEGYSIAEAEFDRWLASERAEAWDEGHVAYQRRNGDDGCSCGAWSGGECLCGLYGTGTLLSVKDNPYRVFGVAGVGNVSEILTDSGVRKVMTGEQK